MNELFKEAEIIKVIPDPPVPKNECLYFLVACWRDWHWKVQTDTYKTYDCEDIKKKIIILHQNGWKNITICKLPELGGFKNV